MINDQRTIIDGAVKALQARLTAAGGPFEQFQLPNGTRRFRIGANTLGEIYQRSRRMGDKPLITIGTQRHSYAAILEPALALAAQLQRENRSGQRIALLLEEGTEWLTWFVAITAAGASCVLPPPALSEDRLARCLESAACRLVVAPPGRVLPISTTNLHCTFPTQPAQCDEVDPDAEALVVFTSGTSAVPKGVVHSHRSLSSGLRAMMLGGALSACMRPKTTATQARTLVPCALVLAPLAYIAGYSAFLICISGGGRIVLAQGVPEDRIIDLVSEEAVQSITGASVDLVRRLIRQPDAAARLHSVRRLQLQGESLQRSLVEEIEALLPEVQLMTGYGLTETAGSIATAAVKWVIETRGCCGPVLPSVDLRVTNEEDQAVACGETGHIQVRGDILMRGYLDADSTARAFTRDGWFRTGDIGSIDRLGWINVIDRNSRKLANAPSGESYCASIEDEVRALEGVDDAAVIVSDDQQTLTIFLQQRPGFTIDVGAVGALVVTSGRWNGPVQVRMLNSLPRTTSGKVVRSTLVSEAG